MTFLAIKLDYFFNSKIPREKVTPLVSNEITNYTFFPVEWQDKKII